MIVSKGHFRCSEHIQGTWSSRSDSAVAWSLRHKRGRSTFGTAPFPGVTREKSSLSPRPSLPAPPLWGLHWYLAKWPVLSLMRGYAMDSLLAHVIVRKLPKSIYIKASFNSLKTHAVWRAHQLHDFPYYCLTCDAFTGAVLGDTFYWPHLPWPILWIIYFGRNMGYWCTLARHHVFRGAAPTHARIMKGPHSLMKWNRTYSCGVAVTIQCRAWILSSGTFFLGSHLLHNLLDVFGAFKFQGFSWRFPRLVFTLTWGLQCQKWHHLHLLWRASKTFHAPHNVPCQCLTLQVGTAM